MNAFALNAKHTKLNHLPIIPLIFEEESLNATTSCKLQLFSIKNQFDSKFKIMKLVASSSYDVLLGNTRIFISMEDNICFELVDNCISRYEITKSTEFIEISEMRQF